MKSKLLAGALLLALTTVGCGKGDPGPAGLPGAAGAGRIISTLNCGGTISGVTGPASSALNGLDIEYDAVLTSSGDVYATANVIDEFQQASGTAFYAAGQPGASNAQVMVSYDQYGAANWGYWNISLDRATLVTSIVYTDPDLAMPVQLTFSPSECQVQNW